MIFQSSRSKMHVILLILAFLPTFAFNALAADDTMKNAVYNGNFEYGIAGWRTTRRDREESVKLLTEDIHIEDVIHKELLVQRLEAEGHVFIINKHAVKVEQGKTYRIEVVARGNGAFSIALTENSPIFLRSVYSPVFELTRNPETYFFEYTPSPDCVEVRPMLRLLETKTDDQPATIRLSSYFFPVSASLFDSSTSWPKSSAYHASQAELLQNFRSKFKDYKPFSEQEKQQIAADVKNINAVLPPYSPMRRLNSNTFELTTSVISLAESGLPASLAILDQEILSRPISFEIESADKIGYGQIDAVGNDLKIDIRQQGMQGPISLDIRGELLYDALIDYTVTLSTEKPVEVKRVSIVLPFINDVARYIRYDSMRSKPSPLWGFGPIPEPGEKIETKYSILNWRNHWQPSDSTESSAAIWEWNDGWMPYFWIGDEKRGLAWISYSSAEWKHENESVTFGLYRQNNEIVAKVNMVSSPRTINGNMCFRFAIQATPPKPHPGDWFRHEIAVANTTRILDTYNELDDTDIKRSENTSATTRRFDSLWWSLWSVGEGSPRVRDPDKLRSLVQAYRHFGIEVLPYLAPSHLTVNSEEGFYYGAETREWAQEPFRMSLRQNPVYSIVRLCSNSFFSEYQAWAIGRMIDEYGISGIYFDNCGITPCKNEMHGCGDTDEKGERHVTVPYMARRNFFMMVRNEFVKRGKQPLIMTHAGNLPGQISFIDYVVIGEGVYGLDFTEAVTMAEMRAYAMGPNQFGTLTYFLPQFSYTGYDIKTWAAAKHTRAMVAVCIQHGTKIWAIFCNKAAGQHYWKGFDLLTEDSVDFLPYWEWKINNKLQTRKIYASLYRQKKQAILAISNLSDANQTVSIKRSDIIGAFGNFTEAKDAIDNQTVNWDNANLSLEVKSKDYRLILLR